MFSEVIQKLSSLRILLFSSSPRRRAIFQKLGIPIEFSSPSLEKPFTLFEEKTFYKHLQYKLSQAPIKEYELVIGADTVVVVGRRILGKPKSYEEAYRHLKKLSGRYHTVYTGVLYYLYQKEYFFIEKSRVKFYPLEKKEIHYVLQNTHWQDKAGAYGIQDIGGMLLIEKIKGDMYNVMGFPIGRFLREIAKVL